MGNDVEVAKTVQSEMMMGLCPNLAAVAAVFSMQPSGDRPQISKLVNPFTAIIDLRLLSLVYLEYVGSVM